MAISSQTSGISFESCFQSAHARFQAAIMHKHSPSAFASNNSNPLSAVTTVYQLSVDAKCLSISVQKSSSLKIEFESPPLCLLGVIGARTSDLHKVTARSGFCFDRSGFAWFYGSLSSLSFRPLSRARSGLCKGKIKYWTVSPMANVAVVK
jgi:hypothetical protein